MQCPTKSGISKNTQSKLIPGQFLQQRKLMQVPKPFTGIIIKTGNSVLIPAVQTAVTPVKVIILPVAAVNY